MAFTFNQLLTTFRSMNFQGDPTGDDTTSLQAIAAQTGLSETAQLQLVANLVDDTTAVAALSYQFFTGATPSQAGFFFLVNSEGNGDLNPNPNDLNDPYYAGFNQENRYYNFAINLATGVGAGAAGFAAAYGALSFAQAVDQAYEAIVGSAVAMAAGIDPAVAKLDIAGRVTFFRDVAAQRAVGGASDANVKAIMIGYLLNEAAKANLGLGAGANRFVLDLTDGVAQFGVDLNIAYPEPPKTFTANKAGFNTANAADSVEGVTTLDSQNDVVNTSFAFLAGSTVNGRAAPQQDVLNITTVVDAAVTLGGGGAGGTIVGIERINLAAGSTALVTGPITGSGVTSVGFGAASLYQTGGNSQQILGSAEADTVILRHASGGLDAGGGDDTVTVTADLALTNFAIQGGAGADTLRLTPGMTLSGSSTVAGFETVAFLGGGTYFLSPSVNEQIRLSGAALAGLTGSEAIAFVAGGAARGLASIVTYGTLTAADITFTLGSTTQNAFFNQGSGGDIVDNPFLDATGVYVGDVGDTFRLSGGGLVNLDLISIVSGFSAMELTNGTDVILSDGRFAGGGLIFGDAGFNSLTLVDTALITSINLGVLTGVDLVDASGLSLGDIVILNSTTAITVNVGRLSRIDANDGPGNVVLNNVQGDNSVDSDAWTGFGNDVINIAGDSQWHILPDSGDDVVNMGVYLQADEVLVDGMSGFDTLNYVDNPTTTNQLFQVVNFEVINISGAAGAAETVVDNIVEAGRHLTINNFTTGGPLVLGLASETNGSVTVNAGGNGSQIGATSNLLVDTYNLGAGADVLVLSATNIVGNVAAADVVSAFKAGGADKLQTGLAGGAVHSATLTLPTAANFITQINNYLVTHNIAPAAGDIVVVSVETGALAGVLVLQDLTGNGVTQDDYVVRLSGAVPTLVGGDFV